MQLFRHLIFVFSGPVANPSCCFWCYDTDFWADFSVFSALSCEIHFDDFVASSVFVPYVTLHFCVWALNYWFSFRILQSWTLDCPLFRLQPTPRTKQVLVLLVQLMLMVRYFQCLLLCSAQLLSIWLAECRLSPNFPNLTHGGSLGCPCPLKCFISDFLSQSIYTDPFLYPYCFPPLSAFLIVFARLHSTVFSDWCFLFIIFEFAIIFWNFFQPTVSNHNSEINWFPALHRFLVETIANLLRLRSGHALFVLSIFLPLQP